MTNPSKLYFLTGFLGSGKTTLINNMLDLLAKKGSKAGVIINDWGQVNIDSSLINHQDDIEITELNNGQIFCSCLTGKFVEALEAFAKYSLEYLLVETSGLANPMTLKNLIADIEKYTGNYYDYRGMICVVDPVNFPTLSFTMNAVEEQVIHSQMILINKIDLVSEKTVNEVESRIRELNKNARIFKTTFAQVDEAIFDYDLRQNNSDEQVERKTKIQWKRNRHYIIETHADVSIEAVKMFAEAVLPQSLRVKGFVYSDHGHYYLDGVNDTVNYRPLKTEGESTTIVVISRIFEEIVPLIHESWQKYCHVEYKVKEG